ncbi:MAG: MFS transporter [Beduini sp.]|uniref:MFS transporter n=1 Tax=Beduini sp. TaxID=1922300 RepID=UPI0011C8D830
MEEKLWTKKYILAVSILFGICFCSNIVLSVLTIFAKNLTGLDTYAGLMTSIFTIAALSVRFAAGVLLDKFNCKRVILSGISLMIIASFLFISCDDITAALVYRAVQGIGFGIASTGASTYVTKVCHPNRLLEGVSYAAIANSLTGVIGPSLAYALIGKHYDQFQLLFIVAALIAVGTFLLMLLGKDAHQQTITSSAVKEKNKKIKRNALCLPVMILFLNSLTQSAITSFVSLYAISLGFAGAGSFFSVNAIGMIASRFVMNPLVKRFGQFRTILINSAVFFISVFLLSKVTAMWQMLVIALPAGFSIGAISPIINTFMIQNMPANKSGIANALYYSSMDIGYAIGSIIWGIVATMTGYANVFFIGALIQIICVVFSEIQCKVFKLR